MPQMNGTGSDGKGPRSGRGLGQCKGQNQEDALSKLGKGEGKRRKVGGGKGRAQRLQEGKNN